MTIETILANHASGFYDKSFKYKGSVVNALIVEEGNRIIEVGGPCHACVNRSLIRPAKNSTVVITEADASLAENKGAVAYYDWLINKSFFSDVFLCKDPVLSLKHGFVKRVDVNAAKWLGASQLARLSTSEFKQNAIAIYDILASELEIHPMLLTFIACTLNFYSDGHCVSYNSLKLNLAIEYHWTNNNETHLPFKFIRTADQLKELCVDNPNKDHWHKQGQDFSENRWPEHSSRVLHSLNERYQPNVLDNQIKTMLESIRQGMPTLLFNQKRVDKPEYVSLWLKAVTELKSTVGIKTNSNQLAFANLSCLESISAELKLGA